jgi:hypothetical protein
VTHSANTEPGPNTVSAFTLELKLKKISVITALIIIKSPLSDAEIE